MAGSEYVHLLTGTSPPSVDHAMDTPSLSRLLFDLVCTYGVPMRHVGNVIQRVALELGVDFPRNCSS